MVAVLLEALCQPLLIVHRRSVFVWTHATMTRVSLPM
jgi:hypothetical protein